MCIYIYIYIYTISLVGFRILAMVYTYSNIRCSRRRFGTTTVAVLGIAVAGYHKVHPTPTFTDPTLGPARLMAGKRFIGYVQLL